MSPVTTLSVARQIESLFDGAAVAGLTDRELIERFTARRDDAGEAAFAAIVTRHGPMVMDICRQVLGAPHDAEDAFQAVFLVLACRARSIRNPDLLGSWLYAVALRTARRARAQIARRRKNDEGAGDRENAPGSQSFVNLSVPTPEQTLLARERAEILYGEIDRLSSSFRLPVVLHYFEGLTLDETARRWNPNYHGVTHDGLFELHGLAPDAEVSVSFLEPKLKLGATVRISGKPGAVEPIVVKLTPCGTTTARLVGPDGRPLRHLSPKAAILMLVAPVEFSSTKGRKEGTLTRHAGALTAIDPVNYPTPPASDDEARIKFSALIPGTTYHFADRSTAGAPPGTLFRKDFTVTSGETRDLGNILIQKPEMAK